MKPNFALSLSFEGIRLLHRTGTEAATVWSLVGDVAIDAPDLASQLAILRKTGLALDPQGLRTKLLIPNDQIKYLALDTTRAGEEDVRRVLDGVTPYAVQDLSFDFVRGGGRTYIAAVARETLAEAEAFAAEHRFGPVCFAGVPDPFTYIGEAFFGPTSMADRLLGAGQTVERDEQPVSFQPKTRLTDKPPVPPVDSTPVVDSDPVTVVDPDAVAMVYPVAGPQTPPAAPLILIDPQSAAVDAALPDPTLPNPNPDPNPDFIAPNLPEPGMNGTKALPPGAEAAFNPELTPNRAAVTAVDQSRLPTVNLAPPDAAALAFTPQAPTIFDFVTATSLALPNLPGQILDDAPFIDVPSDPDPVPVPEAGPVFVNGAAPVPDAAKVMPADIAAIAVSEVEIVARPPLIPEPVFTSRGRTLRADPTDVPVMRQPLLPPPGSRILRSDDKSEPVFSRRTEPPINKPVMPKATALPVVPTADSPPPAFTARTAMAAPQLTGAARQAPEPVAARPFNAKLPTAAAAPAVTGASGIARSAGAVAATVIPFRPLPDQADHPAATPVSIQTVSLTPAKPPLSSPAAPPLAHAVTAPALEPGKPGTFASRHGGAAYPNPKTGQERPVDPLQPLTPQESQPLAQTRPGQAATGPDRIAALGKAGADRATRGKPRYLALVLTLILLACLAAVAAWASLLSPDGLAGLLGRSSTTQVAVTPAAGPSPLSLSDLSATDLVSPSASTALITPPGRFAADSSPDVTALPGLVTPAPTADAVAAIPPEVAAEAPVSTVAGAETGTVVSPAEAERIYAATGVWLRAPRLPLIPTADPVGTISLATLDGGIIPTLQPVMPALAGAAPDQALLTPVDPPAPGTVFQRDARGFVLATAGGTLTPDGILVYAGPPPVIPPNRPGTAEPVALAQALAPTAPQIIAVSAPPLAPRPTAVTADATAQAPDPVLATAGGVGLNALGPVVRPLIRPGNLTPALADAGTPAPATPAPTLAAYAGPTPQWRPQALAPVPDPAVDPAVPDPGSDTGLAVADTVAAILAAAPPDQPEPIATATSLAVASARIPEARPQNFAAVVASAQQRNAPAAPQNPSLAVIDPPVQPDVPPQALPDAAPVAQPDLVSEAQVPDEIVAPNGPIPGGVATNATLEQAIDLREVNLIGVFGRPNDRRALVRLANGRYVRVGVGDSLDGGQVAAIGDNALNYVKRGRTITIAIPNG